MLPLIIAALAGIVGYNLLIEWLKSQESQEQSPVPFYLIIILILAIILATRR